MIIELISAEEFNSTFSLLLVDEEGTTLQKNTLTQGKGLYSNIFYTTITALHDRIKFALTGASSDGFTIQRVAPTLIELGQVELVRAQSESSTNISPGETLTVVFNVSNYGENDQFQFTADSDLSAINVSTTPSSLVQLLTNETRQFSVLLHAAHTVKGVAAVSVSVLHHSGSLMNYKLFHVTALNQVSLENFAV